MHSLNDDLKTFFPKLPFDQLTDLQTRVISNVMQNENTLCIMPTGSGKSVIYWMSGLELQGITIVISPLTALIEEQSVKLEEQGYEVLKLHGDIPAKKQMEILTDFASKKINPKFIFLSPEKIATDGYLEYCLKTRKDDIKLFVIDEVHCVSQWGMTFRPFYKRIPNFIDNLFGKNSWAKILALTATLNPKEIGDICSHFKIDKKNIIMQDVLMRSEIQLHVNKFENEDEKSKKLWEIIHNHSNEKILVYVYRKYMKRGVEDLCQEAVERGYSAQAFHGDMNAEERMDIIEKFKKNEINIIFATNAFGMGIDIPDIRVVIHYMIPGSIEQYYQEVGRASRDHKSANAYLLYSNKNIDIRKSSFIDNGFPSYEKLQTTYAKLASKIGYSTLDYFDDEEIRQCLPYYIDAGLIEIVCKGFAGLLPLENIRDEKLRQLYDSTKSKNFITIVKRSEISPSELSYLVYKSICNGTVTTKKPLERWIIINVKQTEIDDNAKSAMLESIESKKQYQHQLLDYFTYVIENTSNSQQLQQEIAKYLGTDRHNLGLLYKTEDGTIVRSKSEVIISNLLHSAGLTYEYEEKLFYNEAKWIEPDFTIYLPGDKKIFWEHVGMLGREDYSKDWSKKIDIYNAYFPGQMVKTYESGVLSEEAAALIEDIKTNKIK